MIPLSRLTTGNTYRYSDLLPLRESLPKTSVFASIDGEFIIRTKKHHYSYCNINKKDLNIFDHAILEEVGRSKYLSSLQLFEYLRLRGFDISRSFIDLRLKKLMHYRMIQEKRIVKKGNSNTNGIRFFELDHNGSQYLQKQKGFVFYKGIGYVSETKKKEYGIPEDTPDSVKKILAGNQIILSFLKSNADSIERFGIMQTFRINSEFPIIDNCIFRTAATIKIDSPSEEIVLAFEVVRNTPEYNAKLADKVRRFYALINNPDYIDSNFHADHCYPRLVICGECIEHNFKIVRFLKEHELWDDQLLFTEDLLNINEPNIYSISNDGSIVWYSIPKKEIAA